MAISRAKTWIAGEVLTASDLNSEFNNILQNAADLISPLTKAISMGGFALNFDTLATIALTAVTNGLTLTGGAFNTPQGTDIVAAATTNLDTATGNLVDVTGNTGITSITLSQGRVRMCRFTGTPTLTASGNLVLSAGGTALNGSGNIVAAAGDYGIFAGYASSVVRLLGYFRASTNLSVAGTLGVTGAATLSSTLGITGITTHTGGVALPVAGGSKKNLTWPALTSLTAGTDTACSNGDRYWCSIFVPHNISITGIGYLIGSVGGTTKVVVELKDATGASLANSATAGATVGTLATFQEVSFTAPYAAVGPAWYYLVVQFDSATAKFRTIPTALGISQTAITNTAAGTFGTVAAITPGTTFTADKGPIAYTF